MPPGHPFTSVQSNLYWSATTDPEDATHAWLVNFSNGFVGNRNKNLTLVVWCVRGGVNADAY